MTTITLSIPPDLERDRVAHLLQVLLHGPHAHQAIEIVEDIVLGQHMNDAEHDDHVSLDTIQHAL